MAKEFSVKQIIKDFKKEMICKKVPFYVIGSLIKNANSKPIIEIVVKRPEKYNNPLALKNIPKTYKTYKVKIV